MNQILPWIAFNMFVIVMLVLDLKIFHRHAHEVKVKEALGWSAFWIALALLFNLGIYYFRGHDLALTFLTGYLLEKSLSVDNLFVFLVIFHHFQVAKKDQHNVLFWGILGALIMRAIFIGVGVAAIHRFHFVIYFFGAFLVWTAIKLAMDKDKKIEPEKNPVLKFACRFLRVTPTIEGNKFFVKKEGKWFATPLLIVLIVIETTDVVFAVDSIPAILSISRDPFIVYTSNVFAILGLRALYFALAGLMTMFHYLNYGLAAILAFVGVKMLLEDVVNIPIGIALGFILAVLTISIIASIINPKQKVQE